MFNLRCCGYCKAVAGLHAISLKIKRHSLDTGQVSVDLSCGFFLFVTLHSVSSLDDDKPHDWLIYSATFLLSPQESGLRICLASDATSLLCP